jgi:hypothetical protein
LEGLEFVFPLDALGSRGPEVFHQLLDFVFFRLEKLISPGDERIGLVNLRLLLAPFCFGGGDVALVTFDQLFEFLRPLPIELDPAAQARYLALQSLHFRARVADLAVNLIQVSAFRGELVLTRLDFCVRALFGFFEACHLKAASFRLGLKFVKLPARMMGIEHLKIGQQYLVAPRFPCLPLEGTDLAFHFLNDVPDPKKVRFGCFQLAERFSFLRFVLGDAGGLFENRATIFRAGAQNQIDLALLHDGIGAAAHARVGEETLNIAQTALCFVQKVFGISVAINASRHAHIVPVHTQLAPAIRKRQGNLAEADRLARFGSIKNDVRHFAAAQCFRRLFAEHPANGIEHVGFSTTVRPDDGRDAFVKFEDRFIRERFEAEEFERLKMHRRANWPLLSLTSNPHRVTRKIIPLAAAAGSGRHNI